MMAAILRDLPSVHEILLDNQIVDRIPTSGRATVVVVIRGVLDQLRDSIQTGALVADRDELAQRTVRATLAQLDDAALDRLTPVINATGVVLHTSLGRAPLSAHAIRSVIEAAGNCNLEIDLRSGERRHRGYQIEAAWSQLTGAQASLVVNNNAAATLLTLQSLCAGKEVIISRGQLIEIGGSFRLPEIFSLSGSLLKEIGTTNQTHLSDYAQAIGPQTGAILHVHPSNYRILGFSQTPSISELVTLGKQHGLLVIDDIGSGSLIDWTHHGLPAEPTFTAGLQAGADLVLGSGDKLLGGPQCGIILGRRDAVDTIRKHPLARAVRIDKLTLAALSATLELYIQGNAKESIPVLRMLMASSQSLWTRAEAILAAVGESEQLALDVQEELAEVGGGSLPAVQLSTAVIRLRHCQHSANQLASQLRRGAMEQIEIPRVFGRIQSDAVLLDLRSVMPEDDSKLITVLLRHGQQFNSRPAN